MTTDDLKQWDGLAFNPCPSIFLLTPFECSDLLAIRLFAVSEAGPLFTLNTARLPKFFTSHPEAFFLALTNDLLESARSHFPNAGQSEFRILADMLEAGRWINLRLLDELICSAGGKSVFKNRTTGELNADLEGESNVSATTDFGNTGVPSQQPTIWDQMGRLQAATECVLDQLYQFAIEFGRPNQPEYRLNSVAMGELLVRHPYETTDTREETSEESLSASNEITPANGLEWSLCGVQTATRGEMAVKSMDAFRVAAGISYVGYDRFAALGEAAKEKFKEACRELRRHSEAVNAFQWDGEVVKLKNQRIKTTKGIQKWLSKAASRIKDRWGVLAPIPKGSQKYPVENPEHWGAWAACDPALWAWRELERMAGLIKFANATVFSPSRHEIIPKFRSFMPNLETYRRLNVKVLRPASGQVFLAGRVRNLRLRCFVNLGLQRGYFHSGKCRLLNYFFSDSLTRKSKLYDPVDEIAKELHVACEIWKAWNSNGQTPAHNLQVEEREQAKLETAKRAEAKLEPEELEPEELLREELEQDELELDQEAGPDEFQIRQNAEACYEEMESKLPDESQEWRRLTEGLIDAAIQGIPDELLTRFLKYEHDAQPPLTPRAEKMLELLVSKVVYELDECFNISLADVVFARRGQSAQDLIQKKYSSSHPNTYSARVRNEVLGSAGVLGMLPGGQEPDAAVGPADGSKLASGPDLFLMRGKSLGGRYTSLAGKPAVIQQEVNITADEVMMEVLHSLVTAGHKPIAVAGEEFLVQVSEADFEKAKQSIQTAAEAGAASLLDNCLLGTNGRECARVIQIIRCDEW